MNLLNWIEYNWIKLIIFFVIVIFIIGLILYFIEKIILKFFSLIDERKSYSEKKLFRKIKEREDRGRNYFYYGVDYWKWQDNKNRALRKLLPIGAELQDGRVVTDVKSFDKVVPKIFSSGKRHTRYRRELRFIIELVAKAGDQVQGDKVAGDKFVNSGSGIQINTVTKNEVVDSLEKLLASESLNNQDSHLVRQFVSQLLQNRASEGTKQTVVNTLSNYIGIVSGISSIIDMLHNFKIL